MIEAVRVKVSKGKGVGQSEHNSPTFQPETAKPSATLLHLLSSTVRIDAETINFCMVKFKQGELSLCHCNVNAIWILNR